MSKHRNNQLIQTFTAAFREAGIPAETATLTIMVRSGVYLNQKPGYKAVRIKNHDGTVSLTIEANDRFIAVTQTKPDDVFSKEFPTEGAENSWRIFPALTRWVEHNLGTKQACVVADQFVRGVVITPEPRLTRAFQ